MRTLDAFNQQVLACQDDAFTLASYLLGDDHAADEAVATAVRRTYRSYRQAPDHPVRLALLREIVSLCHRPRKRRSDGLPGQLRSLPYRERQSLLLVDALGLSYDEATDVLECSRRELTQWLGRARDRLVGTLATPDGPYNLSQHLA